MNSTVMNSTEQSLPVESTATGGLPYSRAVAYFGLALTGSLADLWSKAAVFRWRGLPTEQPVWWIVEDYFGIRNGRQHRRAVRHWRRDGSLVRRTRAGGDDGNCRLAVLVAAPLTPGG